MVPIVLALLFFKEKWKVAYCHMVATMFVDLDHIFADPFYEPNRCSIGFHPMHEFIPIIFYGIICFFKPLRYVGIGLIIHMALDSVDCMKSNGVWFV